MTRLETSPLAGGVRPRCLELDWIVLAVVVLSCVGLTMAVSVQSVNPHDETTALAALKGQGVKACAGLVVFLLAGMAPLHLMHPDAHRPGARFAMVDWAFFGGLLLTLLPVVVGTSLNGAARWLSFGSFTLQPVDVARLTLVLLVAYRIARLQEGGQELGFRPLLMPAALLAAVLILQPDNGNAVLVFVLASSMAVVAGASMARLAAFATPLLIAGGLYVATHTYVLGRVSSWWEGDPVMQVRRGIEALSSGGVAGQGLGSGWMKLGFVPEARNDFVFTIVGEELGLIGTTTVVALFVIFIAAGIGLTRKIGDPFFRYIVFGCTMAIGYQAVLNLAVTTGLVPPKGIDLPFVSSGGSNLVVSLAAVGLICNAARRGLDLPADA